MVKYSIFLKFFFLVLFLPLVGRFGEAAPAALRGPVALALFPPSELPEAEYSIIGLRMSVVMGLHREVSGFDLGLVGNMTTHEFNGTAISGIFNWNQGSTAIWGLQAAGLVNINEGTTVVNGLQVALLANVNERAEVNGVQLGFMNQAKIVRGLQIGLYNQTDYLYGLQIGLANFVEKNALRFFPIVNAGF